MTQQLVRIDEEDLNGISDSEVDRMIEKVSSIIDEISVVVLSDYNKGVCTPYLCEKLISICAKENKQIVVDPKNEDWTKYRGASLITPNFKEYCEVIGKTIDNSEEEINRYSKEIIEKYGINRILVTRSQYGMYLINSDKESRSFSAIQQEVFDVSGAGDTVIGSIAALLTKGIGYEEATEIANYAAGLSVSKFGTYMVCAEEVIDYINKYGNGLNSKIIPIESIESIVTNWKKQNERIVFTNGCFDILHVGHIEYLYEARKYGTKMIVGINSDESVRRLKGKERPINKQTSRARMLAALQCVDMVVVFEEDTPEKLIGTIMPDYLIKGGDYKVDEIVGRQYARETITIPLTEGFSTTGLIEKIKSEK